MKLHALHTIRMQENIMLTIMYDLISDISRLLEAAINMSIINGKLKTYPFTGNNRLILRFNTAP